MRKPFPKEFRDDVAVIRGRGVAIEQGDEMFEQLSATRLFINSMISSSL